MQVRRMTTLLEARQRTITLNRIAGAAREKKALELLRKEHPNADILSQRSLRDSQGSRLIDLLTGKGRRLDFVVVENGKVVKLVEVTSLSASKTAQLAKTARIRARWNPFVIGQDGKLIRIDPHVPEVVIRLP